MHARDRKTHGLCPTKIYVLDMLLLGDALVHERLREGRLVRFVVTESTRIINQ